MDTYSVNLHSSVSTRDTKKEKKKKVSTTKHLRYPANWLSSIPYNSLNVPAVCCVAESGTREASTPSKARGGDKRKRGEKFRAAGGCGDAEESIGGAE